MPPKSIITLCLLALFALGCQNAENEKRTNPLIIKHIPIYQSRQEYCAWPDMVRAANGDLLITFCLTEEHLSPDGKVALMRSPDNGNTWEGPVTIFDSPLDDRDQGMTVLNDSRILLHVWSYFHTKEKYETIFKGSYRDSVLARWIDFVSQPEYRNADSLEGAWCTISNDNGKSWSKPFPGKDTIHGGIQLPDGTILVAAYREQKNSVGVFKADSSAQHWEQVALVESPKPDSVRFGEPHILQLPSGRIIMMIRATAVPYNDQSPRCNMWETYSDDNGLTWATPFFTPLWGFPPHLLLLSDGRVLCTYGYRRAPFGQRACVSSDGITWNKADEIILRDDAFNSDLGYPASVELEPGLILSIYYQPDTADGRQELKPPDPGRAKPDIWGTIWRVPAGR